MTMAAVRETWVEMKTGGLKWVAFMLFWLY